MDAEERAAWLEAHPTPEGFEAITEGAARVIFENKNEVFYNPAQEVNRDLSVLVLRLFAEQSTSAAVHSRGGGRLIEIFEFDFGTRFFFI
jgi:tRNA G26 N,N-dimethylase Trm1